MRIRAILKIRRWFHERPTPVILFCVSFIINCTIGLLLYLTHGSDFVTLGDDDSSGYISLARSIASGNGFMLDGVVSALRPPLYPLFLSFFIFFGLPLEYAIFVQYIAASISVVLIYSIGARMYSSKAGIIAAGLFMVEPYMLLLNSTAMTETIFVSLSLAGVYSILRLLEGEKYQRWSISIGIFFGLATLTRPNVFYIPVIVLLLAIIGGVYSEKFKKVNIKAFVLFLFIFSLVLAPWGVRQYTRFGSVRPSSVDTYLLYWRVLPIALAHENNVTYRQAIDMLQIETPQKIPNFDPLKMQHTFEYDHILKKEVMSHVRGQVLIIVNFYLSSVPVTLLRTGYTRILEEFGIPEHRKENITSLLAEQRYGQAVDVLLKPSVYQLVHLLGAFLWICIYGVIIAKAKALVRRDKRMNTIVLCLCILYLTVFAIGPQVYVRYQLVIYPYWLLLFAGALSLQKKK